MLEHIKKEENDEKLIHEINVKLRNEFIGPVNIPPGSFYIDDFLGDNIN